MPIMATTTINSTRVKAKIDLFGVLLLRERDNGLLGCTVNSECRCRRQRRDGSRPQAIRAPPAPQFRQSDSFKNDEHATTESILRPVSFSAIRGPAQGKTSSASLAPPGRRLSGSAKLAPAPLISDRRRRLVSGAEAASIRSAKRAALPRLASAGGRPVHSAALITRREHESLPAQALRSRNGRRGDDAALGVRDAGRVFGGRRTPTAAHARKVLGGRHADASGDVLKRTCGLRRHLAGVLVIIVGAILHGNGTAERLITICVGAARHARPVVEAGHGGGRLIDADVLHARRA